MRKKILVESKTGFRTLKGVKVYQFGKLLPFYLRPFKTDFNLPSGVYEIEGDFIKLNKPVIYNLPKLPKFERSIKIPSIIQVSYSENPNKATINTRTGEITLDNSFLKFPAYVRTFIFYHEIGHYFYSTEKYCDLFATKKMLEKGYNLSQIKTAQEMTLSNGGNERKCFIHDHLKKC